MYRTIASRLPACRSALAPVVAAALAAGAGLFLAPAARAVPAHSGPTGSSTAAVLRANLDVSLLARSVDVPVNASLNDVKAPADAHGTALTVTVGHGVEAGRGIPLLRASAATANATAAGRTATATATIAHAQVHVPGVPLLSLVGLDAVTSEATCAAGLRPTASSHLAGVTVLGRKVALDAVGTTHVSVPGVGTVDLDLTTTATTSDSAAATALQLKLHLNPLSLGVADVTGTLTLAQATCHVPQGGSSGSSGGSGGTAGTSTGGSSSGSSGGPGHGGTTSGTTGGSSTGGSNGGATNGASAGSASGGGSGTSGGGANGGSAHGGSSSGAGSAGASSASGGSSGGNAQTVADTASTGNLADTGASSTTPYLVAGAIALVAAGASVFVVSGRRRRASHAAGTPEA